MANNSSWCTKDPACGVHVEFFFTLKHRLWSWSQFSSDGLGLKLLDEAQTCYYLARLWSSVHVVAGLLPVTSTRSGSLTLLLEDDALETLFACLLSDDVFSFFWTWRCIYLTWRHRQEHTWAPVIILLNHSIEAKWISIWTVSSYTTHTSQLANPIPRWICSGFGG
ncbi:uncharacterized protein [Triticum aestivum]|uniref:uncharacterized protein isoform X2 n=1 Tax=Triticum aestivum TaxID=4565 RepID=UPI001D02546A|nr:uncharacterized protein LOC123174229 isoform X2 [Triticum aestivum]